MLIKFLAKLWVKFRLLRTFIGYFSLTFLIAYLIGVLAISNYTDKLVFDAIFVFTKAVWKIIWNDYATYIIGVFLIENIFFFCLLLRQYRLLNSSSGGKTTIEKELAEIAVLWLDPSKLQQVKKREVEIVYAFMLITDKAVNYFAHMTFKPLLDERNILFAHGAVVDKIIHLLQTYGKTAPSVVGFENDPNRSLRKSATSKNGKNHYEVFKEIPLLDHSLRVAAKILEMSSVKENHLQGAALLAALGHDLGKIELKKVAEFEDNQVLLGSCLNKPHQVKSSKIVKHIMDTMRIDEISEREREMILEAIEAHHTNVIPKEMLENNPLAQALIDADKQTRANELKLYEENSIRLIEHIKQEAARNCAEDIAQESLKKGDNLAQEKSATKEPEIKEQKDQHNQSDKNLNKPAQNTAQDSSSEKYDEARLEEEILSENLQEEILKEYAQEPQQGSATKKVKIGAINKETKDAKSGLPKSEEIKPSPATQEKTLKTKRVLSADVATKLPTPNSKAEEEKSKDTSDNAHNSNKTVAQADELKEKIYRDNLWMLSELNSEEKGELWGAEVQNNTLFGAYRAKDSLSAHAARTLKLLACFSGVDDVARGLAHKQFANEVYELNSLQFVLTGASEAKIRQTLANHNGYFDIYSLSEFSDINDLVKVVLDSLRAERKNESHVMLRRNCETSAFVDAAITQQLMDEGEEFGLIEFDFDNFGAKVIEDIIANINTYKGQQIQVIQHDALILVAGSFIKALLKKHLEQQSDELLDGLYKYFATACFKRRLIQQCNPLKGYFHSTFKLQFNGNVEDFYCLAFRLDALKLRTYELPRKNEFLTRIKIEK